MVDITPAIPADRQFIDSYRPGGFRVSGQLYEGSILVFPQRTLPWPVTDIAGLTPESLAVVQAEAPPVEVILVGCGTKVRLLPAALRQSLRAAGLHVEIMDTGAACRTYNVLLAEERRVAAALIPI